jgi:hypothetical protein
MTRLAEDDNKNASHPKLSKENGSAANQSGDKSPHSKYCGRSQVRFRHPTIKKLWGPTNTG